MQFAPLLTANVPIKIHVASVAVVIVLTPIQFLLKRGGTRHRALGKIWMVAMALTALSSFFISTIRMIGPFSPLHLLAIVSLISLALAYRAARRGDSVTHAWTMISLTIFALFIPGVFTLWPGRIMNAVLFGP
jgi:uncharacterized membrane protein